MVFLGSIAGLLLSSLWCVRCVLVRFELIGIVQTPIQVTIEMMITVFALRYQWGMRAFDLLLGSLDLEEEISLFMEEDFGDRPTPGEQ